MTRRRFASSSGLGVDLRVGGDELAFQHVSLNCLFLAERGSLPNSATHQHVWKNNHRYLLSGSFGETADLIPDPLQKEKRLCE